MDSVATVATVAPAAAGAGAGSPSAAAVIPGRYFYPSADGTTIIESPENQYKLPGDLSIDFFVRLEMYKDYHSHQAIGRGGFGDVYKLNFPTESFVLKVINKKTRLAEIEREIGFLITLKGKWFSVQLIAAGIVPGGNSYILYPYVEGNTLDEMLIQEGFVYGDLKPTGKKPDALERKDFLHIYNRLIDATYELHQMGMIHHDIKHENIWITADGEPFFLDFGLSAHVGEPVGRRGTNGFVRRNRYRDEGKPAATANINWYALGKTLEVFNPNSAGRLHHISLQRPALTNNAAKAVRYLGGRRTRRQKNKKRQTRRFRRKL